METKTLDVRQLAQEFTRLNATQAAMAMAYARGLRDAQSMAEARPADDRKPA